MSIFHMQHLSVPAYGPSQRICADESLLSLQFYVLLPILETKSLHLSYIKYGFVVVVGVLA